MHMVKVAWCYISCRKICDFNNRKCWKWLDINCGKYLIVKKLVKAFWHKKDMQEKRLCSLLEDKTKSIEYFLSYNNKFCIIIFSILRITKVLLFPIFLIVIFILFLLYGFDIFFEEDLSLYLTLVVDGFWFILEEWKEQIILEKEDQKQFCIKRFLFWHFMFDSSPINVVGFKDDFNTMNQTIKEGIYTTLNMFKRWKIMQINKCESNHYGSIIYIQFFWNFEIYPLIDTIHLW